jgi:UDP-GlcNAc:undecaprenyl-phosphate GlcNAc-1-phosphate transferase
MDKKSKILELGCNVGRNLSSLFKEGYNDLSGIEIKYVTNPAGGIINITSPVISMVIVFLWLLGMTYTTKLLDGLDGLVAGITFIASIILFSVSLFWDINMSGTSILCLILAGSSLGFLFFNFYPARIFLGEGGSTFLGFMLGVLAIISGAKIATALLIMGLPILDVVWVIARRLFKEKHSLALADKKHLHFRLLASGLNQRQTVLLMYFLTLLFGSIAVFQKTIGKIIALAVLTAVMFILALLVVRNKPANIN